MTKLVIASLVACLLTATCGTIRKIQIDARAHVAEAEGLLAMAGEEGSLQRVRAGEALVRAMGSYVPIDPTMDLAESRLLWVLEQLASDGHGEDVERLRRAAIARIDQDAWLFAPRAGFRQALLAIASGTGRGDER